MIPWNKGKKLSEAQKKVISEQRKKEWATGTRKGGWKQSKPRSLEYRLKLSIAKKGKPLSENHRKKLRENHVGRTGLRWTAEQRKNLSEKKKGSNNNFWKGGVSTKNMEIRNSFEYREWRKGVFERDDYRCLDCGVRGGVLEADHIYPFSLFPRLRMQLENGRTLCHGCHKKTQTYMKNIFVLKKLYNELMPLK